MTKVLALIATLSLLCLNVSAAPVAKTKGKAAPDKKVEVRSSTDSVMVVDTSTIKAASDSLSKKSGAVVITTTPDSASVYLNDSLLGITPLTLEKQDTGSIVVLIKKPGHYVKKAPVSILADTVTSYSFALTRPARLVVTSQPVGAAVWLDKKAIGTTPLVDSLVKPGTYEVVFVKDLFDTAKISITLESGASDTVSHTLIARVAKPQAGSNDTRNPADVKSEELDRIGTIVATGLFVVIGIVIVTMELLVQ